MGNLCIDHLVVSHGNTYRLAVECQLATGRMWQVIGANASGKTTLLSQLLYGQTGESPSVGIDGTPISTTAVGALEYRALFHKWTVAQNLSYFLPGHSKDGQGAYLGVLVDESWYSQRVYKLSSAQRKRVLIAILLEQEQSVLILDELDDAFDETSLRLVLSAISLWIADDRERIAVVACKKPIATIRDVLEIVPTNHCHDSYEVRVTSEFND